MWECVHILCFCSFAQIMGGSYFGYSCTNWREGGERRQLKRNGNGELEKSSENAA